MIKHILVLIVISFLGYWALNLSFFECLVISLLIAIYNSLYAIVESFTYIYVTNEEFETED